jgi:hypothetical protein
VERRYRLPRLALVQDGRLQAWKARKVAQQTTHLSVDAVAFVKRHIATTAIRNRLPQLPALIHEALLRCDPDQAAGVEEVALNARGVWFDHRHSTATTELTASLDTPDALDLEASVSDLAVHLGRLGDTRSLQNRRATALGMLANPQRTLDLLRGADAADQQAQQSQRAGSEDHHDNVLNPATRCPATLYLHIDHDDLQAHAAAGGGAGVGTVEKLGAATLRLLQEWLARANGVTIRPVLDMTRLEGGRPARPTRLDA